MDAERNWSQQESLAHLCMEHGIRTFAEIHVADRSLDLGWEKAIWYYVKP